jgi:O-antigen/teichoic acid export membrane protein
MLFLAVISITATAVTLRYETTILLPKSEDESRALVYLALGLASMIGGLLAAISWLLPDSGRGLLGLADLKQWMTVAVVASIGTAVITVVIGWFNRRKEYKKIAVARVLQSTAAATAGIILGIAGCANGLLYAQLIAVPATLFFIMLSACKDMKTRPSFSAITAVAVKHYRAPAFLLPTALLDVFTMQLPVILITAWFTSEAAGQFSMAWRILALPMSLIGGAIGQVFFQRFSQAWPNVIAARNLLFGTWKVLAIGGLLPTITIMLFGEQLFGWILGEPWRQAGKIAVIIAPMIFLMLISSPTSSTFIVLNLQKYSLLFGAAFLFYRIASIYTGSFFNSLPIGLVTLVLCELVAIIIYNMIVLFRIKNEI